ncbi:MAG: hypothetical protein N2971_08290 [Chlorobi bacterium]|nr:hypothetical protein [Chlorobiota bacterium]
MDGPCWQIAVGSLFLNILERAGGILSTIMEPRYPAAAHCSRYSDGRALILENLLSSMNPTALSREEL